MTLTASDHKNQAEGISQQATTNIFDLKRLYMIVSIHTCMVFLYALQLLCILLSVSDITHRHHHQDQANGRKHTKNKIFKILLSYKSLHFLPCIFFVCFQGMFTQLPFSFLQFSFQAIIFQ